MSDAILLPFEAEFYAPHKLRVAGLEREYGIQQYLDGTHKVDYADSLSQDTVIHLMRRRAGVRSIEGMSRIGRLYKDLYGTPELATNEYVDYYALELAQEGGDDLVVRGLQSVLRARPNKYQARDEHLMVSVRSSDDQGVYFGGQHVSLSMARSAYDSIMSIQADGCERIEQLASFLLLLSLVVGCGSLQQDKAGSVRFHPFERLHAMEQLYGMSSTRERPIVHTRDEAHVDTSTLYHARLHTIALDAHTQPLATATQVAALSAMLRTFELNKPIPYTLVEPYYSLRLLKDDPHAKLDVIGDDKFLKMDSYEATLKVFEYLLKLAKEEGFPDQERQALERLVDGTTAYVNGEVDSKTARIAMPWVSKWQYMKRFDLYGRPISEDQQRELRSEMRQFDSYIIRPHEVVLGSRLQKMRSEDRVAAARAALRTPSVLTRAAERVKRIEAAPKDTTVIHARWDNVNWMRSTKDGDSAETRNFDFPHPRPLSAKERALIKTPRV